MLDSPKDLVVLQTAITHMTHMINRHHMINSHANAPGKGTGFNGEDETQARAETQNSWGNK